MQKQKFLLVLVVTICLVGGLWYFHTIRNKTSTVPEEARIVENTNVVLSVPTGFHSLYDTQLNMSFNVPADWKPQVLPEGDGQPSLISGDYSYSFEMGKLTGAYLHYYFNPLPDEFKGDPAGFIASLEQGSVWTKTTLDEHAAFISNSGSGATNVISQFGPNWFVLIQFVDPNMKYGAVFAEFLRSFHAVESTPASQITLPDGFVGQPYYQPLESTGITEGNLDLSIGKGNLPSNFSIRFVYPPCVYQPDAGPNYCPPNLVLSGMPVGIGTYHFTITAATTTTYSFTIRPASLAPAEAPIATPPPPLN